MARTCEYVRGADTGMAGEGHLGGTVEDAHAGGIHGIGRRQDECRLAQVELEGKRLHLHISETPCIGEDSERIAAELLAGKHIHGHVSPLHGLSASLVLTAI